MMSRIRAGLLRLVACALAAPTFGCADDSFSWRFDIGFVDPASETYYLADRTNEGIDAFDAKSGEFMYTVGARDFDPTLNPWKPSGVLVANGKVVAALANSQVVFFDAQNVFSPDNGLDTVSTGGTERADEMAYDPEHNLVLVTNPEDSPPFVTFIGGVGAPGPTAVARIVLPHAVGLEQPVWDPSTKNFYVPLVQTVALPGRDSGNPGGEVDVIDPVKMAVSAVYPLPVDCNPAGMVVGPNDQMLIGCSSLPAITYVMNLRDGSIIAAIHQVGAADQVAYSPREQRYYVAASQMTRDGTMATPVSPVLGIIDAKTNTWISNLPTGIDEGAHSVAVNPVNNHVFVPRNHLGLLILGDD